MANYNGPLRPSKLDLIIFFVAVATVFCYKWASAVTNLLCYHRNRIICATRCCWLRYTQRYIRYGGWLWCWWLLLHRAYTYFCDADSKVHYIECVTVLVYARVIDNTILPYGIFDPIWASIPPWVRHVKEAHWLLLLICVEDANLWCMVCECSYFITCGSQLYSSWILWIKQQVVIMDAFQW